MQQLTTEQLKQKMANGEDFILDLFAVWCGPCKVMLSNLEKVNESLIRKKIRKQAFTNSVLEFLLLPRLLQFFSFP